MAFLVSVVSVTADILPGVRLVGRILLAADDSAADMEEAKVAAPAGVGLRTGASASAFCRAAERRIGALFVVIGSPRCGCGRGRQSHPPRPARPDALSLLVPRHAPRAPARARAPAGARQRLRRARLQ